MNLTQGSTLYSNNFFYQSTLNNCALNSTTITNATLVLYGFQDFYGDFSLNAASYDGNCTETNPTTSGSVGSTSESVGSTSTGTVQSTTSGSTTGQVTPSKIIVPLDGNVTVSYPYGSYSATIHIPFKLNNATAEVVLADSSNPLYKDPRGSGIPGKFKDFSIFITIYDSNGTEVHEKFSEPIELVLEGDFSSNDKLFLYDIENDRWLSVKDTCASEKQVQKVENGKYITNLCHLTQFALFEEEAGSTVAVSSKGFNKLLLYIVIPVGGAVIIGAVILTVFLVKRRKRNGFF